jgi:uncharacterized protein DUF4145
MAPIIQPARGAGPLNPTSQPMLGTHLVLDRCPHCGVAKPLLFTQGNKVVSMRDGGVKSYWNMYGCSLCGGMVLATSYLESGTVVEYYPPLATPDTTIPEPAREYLRQAQESLASPAGALMLCASSVDAMLKEKGLKKGTLNERINQAAKDHLITEGMAKWAHQVRLEANEPRHADDKKPLPMLEDAKRCVAFTVALAEFLFVLPARVTRGIAETKKTPGTGKLQLNA